MSRVRGTNPVWGLALLATALVLLLRGLGVLPEGLFDLLQRSWPVLLVLFGLTLLLRARLPYGSVVALVVSAGLIAVMAAIAYANQSGELRDDYEAIIDQPISDSVTLLVVNIETRATEVEIRGGEAGAPALTGVFTGSASSAIEVSYAEDDLGRGEFTLRETEATDFPALEAVGRGRLRLDLPPQVPVALVFAGASGDVLLDMSSLQLERLNVDAESGNVAVTIPAYAPQSPNAIDQPGEIRAGNGTVTLFIPEDVTARLELNRQGSGLEPEFDEAIYRYLQGDVLEARGFETEDGTIKLRYRVTAPRGVIRVEDSQSFGTLPAPDARPEQTPETTVEASL